MKKKVFVFLTLLFSTILSAKTITVTSDKDSGTGTLREAVTNADNGDVIIFDENITVVYFAGVIKIDKNITISGNETKNTIFQNAITWTDKTNKKRYFEILKNAKVTFNYLTLKDNTANCTGGAIVNNGNLTLNNCTFSNNRPYDSAGAILSYGDLTIDNCDFINNYCTNGSGGAILFNSDAKTLAVTNSRFTGNYVPGVSSGQMYGGGAIYISTISTANISDCVFEKNTASNGGAICNYGTATIDNCIFKKNKASEGGAICNGNLINISNSPFLQNEAVNDGIFYNALISGSKSNAKATLVNCIFTNNTITGNYRPEFLGIISTYKNIINDKQDDALLTLINCTVANNTGVGITYLWAAAEIYNTVLWNNISNNNYSQYDVYDYSGRGIFTAYNSIIGTSNLNLTGNNNILGEDPLFAGYDDYSLQENSPAIDRGNNTHIAGITTDLLGMQRISNGTVDIGAHEYQANTSAIPPTPATKLKIYTRHHTIIIENTTQAISIYNIGGQLVAQGTEAGSYAVLAAGVYIVRVGSEARKVIVP
jgi:predicted outer membrane repeat protein